MSNVLRVVALLAILSLGGCASLSRNECAAGDWVGIGLRDGANGYTEDRFADHAKACIAHGITADRDRWLAGRERGLDRYCNARHAFEVGANNSSYEGVCAGPTEEDFLHGYRLGRATAEARERRSHWDSEIHNLRHRLDEDSERGKSHDHDGAHPDERPRLTDAERVEIGVQLGVALVRRDEADRDVAELEQRSLRL
jgi:Protein of unknown function (DUF2799)